MANGQHDETDYIETNRVFYDEGLDVQKGYMQISRVLLDTTHRLALELGRYHAGQSGQPGDFGTVPVGRIGSFGRRPLLGRQQTRRSVRH